MDVTVDDIFKLAGTTIDGRYAVERPVARGGFGVVYRTTRLDLAMPVALKVLLIPAHLRGEADELLIERFRNEARTLATLNHPAIVRVLELGRLDTADPNEPCVWMALEWLDGVTLDRHLDAKGRRPLSPRESLDLLGPVFDAVASVHERGVAHRDLKPTNIMLCPTPRGGCAPRVLDFGIAKVMQPDDQPGTGTTETRSDVSAFSLQHAAPEQVGRARTGPWTDVHALGLLLTEVMVGEPAYLGKDSFTLYGTVMSPDRPTPRRRGLDVGAWEPILEKALSLLPSDRYADAGALYDALKHTVDDAQARWERPRHSDAPPVAAARLRPSAVRGIAFGVAAVATVAVLLIRGAVSTAARSPDASVQSMRAPPSAPPAALADAPTVAPVPIARAPIDAALEAVFVARPPPPRVALPPARPRVAPPSTSTDPDIAID